MEPPFRTDFRGFCQILVANDNDFVFHSDHTKPPGLAITKPPRGRRGRNMSIRSVFGAAMCMLFAATTANATPTHWEFQGRFTSVSGSDAPAGVAPGTPFRIVVGFDTDATLIGDPQPGSAGGFRYNYTSPMRWQIYAGPECNPCELSVQNGNIILRDDYSNGEPAVDGYSFGAIDDDTDLNLTMRGTTTDIVNGPSLALEPDPRLADLAIAGFEVCGPYNPYTCSRIALNGEIDAVIRPTLGTGYILTARDCRLTPNQFDNRPNDCFDGPRPVDGVWVSGTRLQRWSFPAAGNNGGGVGGGTISQHFTPTSGQIDANYDDGATWQAALGLPDVSLGSVFGSIGFGGPAALPVIKGYSIPSDISRTNSNLYAYQKYKYSGGVSDLPLVLDLTYSIDENSEDLSASPFVGDRPGGAQMGATLSIVDGNVPIELLKQAGDRGFNNVVCNNEAALGFPAGSILGAASHGSLPGETGQQAVLLEIRSCSSPDQLIQLAAGQDFYVATSMQIPARGKMPQPGSTSTVTTNGYVDAANTLRITFDPEAPPELVQALVAAIEPGCEPNCDFPTIDVKPGDSANCVNVTSKGVIPVALLGTASLPVREVSIPSLRLGSLQPAVRKGRAQCSISSVNGDELDDLVCHFQNSATNWTVGQAVATLTGESASGPLEASDKVCLKP